MPGQQDTPDRGDELVESLCPVFPLVLPQPFEKREPEAVADLQLAAATGPPRLQMLAANWPWCSAVLSCSAAKPASFSALMSLPASCASRPPTSTTSTSFLEPCTASTTVAGRDDGQARWLVEARAGDVQRLVAVRLEALEAVQAELLPGDRGRQLGRARFDAAAVRRNHSDR